MRLWTKSKSSLAGILRGKCSGERSFCQEESNRIIQEETIFYLVKPKGFLGCSSAKYKGFPFHGISLSPSLSSVPHRFTEWSTCWTSIHYSFSSPSFLSPKCLTVTELWNIYPWTKEWDVTLKSKCGKSVRVLCEGHMVGGSLRIGR